VHVLLISTYELGRQPFGLASAAAWLRRAGFEVDCADLSRTRLDEAQVVRAAVVAFYLPMHTATRLAVPVIDRVRRLNPRARLCAYGLYAALNRRYLESLGVERVIGGEFEADLVGLAQRVRDAADTAASEPPAARVGRAMPRLQFIAPDRGGLPPLARYAKLEAAPGVRKLVGYTEASRGCRHLCRHCPIVPVYQGQFRVVPVDVVIADVRGQVAQGATHITFGDPDFFNGVTHALRIVDAVARECPGITYDVTIKVEHLLKHREHLATLRDTGCAFVTTAVESLDDEVLRILDKGHTRRDFFEVVELARTTGLALSPTFVAFTPWTTLASYCELIDTVDAEGLVGHVAPIQWAIRLLLPEGSRLLDVPEVRAMAGRLHPATLTHPWRHRDPEVDRLQQDVERLVGVRLNAGRDEIFDRISTLAHDRAGLPRRPPPLRSRATIPYLNEPWYC
jgi:radical SAM superfamily enzyme YgiQ (UPF0313 family)